PVPANGQVAGQPMPGQPVPGQPVQGQAMPGQAMPGQPAMRPVQNNSTGTADGASNR
ncbi:conjugative transfer protein, partial [Stenotrophomonas geniculata]